MRRARRARQPEPVTWEAAKVQATTAASHAMRSRGFPTEERPYDRLGGPEHVAIPRRPGSSLQYTEDSFSAHTGSIAPPVTPRQSMETIGAIQGHRPEISAALPPITELRGLDGRDNSVPSSYRRLRKAKSMFSTRARSSHIVYETTLMSPPDGCGSDRSPEFELARTLRPSVPFIRGHRQENRAIRHAKSQDTAIQLARSQFLEETEGFGTQVRRSSFFNRRKREHRPFRKTFRVSSNTGIGASFPSEHAYRRGSGSRSRTFSSSIKNGFRRVFGFSNPTGQQPEPYFQSEASTSITPTEPMVDGHLVENAVGGNVGMRQCRMSSPFPADQLSPGRDSLCTSKSRVTSWADSTVANSEKTRKIGHHQSLSLIEEHGDLNKQLPQVPVDDRTHSRLPFCDETIDSLRQGTSAGKFDSWADSSDLYSALVHQIRRQAVFTPDENAILGTVPAHCVIPERTSSVFSHRSRQTIRHVPSGESSVAGSFATARVGDSMSPQRRHPYPLKYTPSKIAQCISGQENHLPLGNLSDGKSPQSPYVIGEGSDEDTGSVIIARFEALRTGAVSPSVYSRTTSGNTPRKGSSGCVTSVPDGETGTATIFASQRAAYSSPTRTKGSIPSGPQVQPSADWQKWMNSQIEMIEKTSPIREHFREGAQFLEDDDDIFMGMLRRAPLPSPEADVGPLGTSEQVFNGRPAPEGPKPLTQNNFSRPFSRSSSVRTILSSQRAQRDVSARSQPQLPSAEGGSGPALDSPPGPAWVPSGQIPSMMRTRSSNMLPALESPTPRRFGPESQKRTWARYSARLPNANGKNNRFRSMRTYRTSHGTNNENTRQQEEHDEMMVEYHNLQDIHSTISSKRMVEMFLDSRRRQMGRDESGSNVADEAFV
ncbi:uncharacterized protein N7482_002989 [Penicillium canariense]|uniref:Uncharacterized protein n=1 Tax=Penicillium canariense TaxID=189055 RepID=A0A9W9IIK8_9EURO|nr:uncharacterized protein N7482_002989 [Penicillium canariense]KAJ5177112.1 hypothetical protein N7482_002989 [Penicillium canariense]